MVVALVLGLVPVAAACGDGGASGAPDRGSAVATTATEPADGALSEPAPPPPTEPPGPPPSPPLTRPDWLGTRVLEHGGPHPTPPELDPRRLPTVDVLPPPADGAFHAEVVPVPPDVAARSTWHPGCPVSLDDLRYVTLSFWGFDDRAHTGEMLVHRDAAEPVVAVFRELFAARFPVEDMHVTPVAELHAPNTGDGNATAAFVCRPTRGSGRWSEHAYGLAVDINPFQNPYVRDGAVTPGLAGAYVDRSVVRPGMVVPGAGVIEAFAAAGWGWGGDWHDPLDLMHFSARGR